MACGVNPVPRPDTSFEIATRLPETFYFFAQMAGGTRTCSSSERVFSYTNIYANYLLFHVLFIWILISICLLTYLCQQNHMYLFIYANYLLFHVLYIWILISICQQKQVQVSLIFKRELISILQGRSRVNPAPRQATYSQMS